MHIYTHDCLFTDCVIEDDGHPLLFANGSNQFKLRRKFVERAPKPVHRSEHTDGGLGIPQLLSATSPIRFDIQGPLSSDSDPQRSGVSSHSGVDQSSMSLSDVHLHKGKLQLHSELIGALRGFASGLHTSQDTSSKLSSILTREEVLEQAVLEQNQILDIMQSLVSSLESENKSFREKINIHSRTILELASWEARAKKAERKLDNVTSSRTGFEVSGVLTDYEKALAEKDQLIASLNTKLNLSPDTCNQAPIDSSAVSSNARLISAKTKLETERVRVIELEEELSTKKEELIKLKEEIAERQSVLISKESEVLHLHHEMNSVKKFQTQQQELVLRQRTALMDKDAQLTSLTRALGEEKKHSEHLRKRQLHLGSSSSFLDSKVADSNFKLNLPEPMSPLTPCLFEQVLGRNIIAVEVTKLTADTELGFSFSKMDLPVSSKVPCLIVKAVKQGSITFGLLKPGDEILEINNISCRGPHQDKATDFLHSGVGTIRIVLARDEEPSFDFPLHSTPAKPRRDKDAHSTLWATALSGDDDDTVYKSFTATVSSLPLSESTSDKYVSVPGSLYQSFALSTVGESRPPRSQDSSPSTSNEAISRASHHKGDNTSSFEADTSKETISYKRLQLEFADLQDQFEDSERLHLDLEAELDECRAEIDNIQMEHDLTKAENFELQQHVTSYGEEVTQIQSYTTELQTMLSDLQGQMTDEQQRTASYENRNRVLTRELDETKQNCEIAQEEAATLKGETEKLRQVSTELEQLERNKQEELEQIRRERDRFQTVVASKDSRIEELTLELEKKQLEFETSVSDARKQNTDLTAKLEILKRASSEAASSVEEEQSKVKSQLKSAKNLLIEAERKESQRTIEIRYLKQAADEANRQLSETEDRHKKLEGESRSYKEEVENLTLKNESLNLGLKRTQVKLEDKEEMLIRLQQEVNNLRRNTAKFNNERSRFKEEISKLQSSLTAAKSEQERREEKLHDSNKEKDSLFQELEESVMECTQLQQKIDDMESAAVELEALKDEVKSLEGQANKLREELTSDKETTAKKIELMNIEKKALEEELVRKERMYQLGKDDTQTAASQIQEEMSRLELELQKQREALVASEVERVQLSQECELLKNKDVEQKTAINKLIKTNLALKEELDSAKMISKEVNRKLETCQIKLEALKQQCSKYKEGITATEASSESLQKQLNEVSTERDSLTALKEDLEHNAGTLQETLCGLRTEVNLREEALSEAKGTCGQLQEELRLEKMHSEETKAAMTTLQNQLNVLQSAKKQNEDMVSSMDFILKQEQAKMKDVQVSLTSKESEAKSLKEQLSKVTDQLHLARTEKDASAEKLTELKLELEGSEESKNQEVSALKVQIENYRSQLSKLQDEYQAMDASCSKHQSLSSQLHTTVEHANKERYSVQKSLEEALKEKGEFETKTKLLEGQIDRLKADISQLEDTSNSLSSETADSRQQLRQREREIDKLSAQVQAAEINLEVANRTLESEKKQGGEYIEAAVHLQKQLKETQERLEESRFKVQRGNLELHACEEQKSQLKTNLDLRQKECDHLQKSLVEAQASTNNLKKKAKTLETKKKDLCGTVNQLQESQKELQLTVQTIKKESAERLESERKEASRLGVEVRELTDKERDHIDKIKKLERSLDEAKSNVEQLLAAQKALKQSLSSLGSEKDVEILRLSTEVTDSRTNLAAVQKELGESETANQALRARMEENEQFTKSTEKQNKELRQENSRLDDEVGVLKSTEAELTELHSKISTLEGSLHTKGVKVAELKQRYDELESELKAAQTDNENYQSKVSELANVKLELVETSSEMDRLKNQVATESKTRKEAESERDQLLTMLRKLEVEKHTVVVQQPTPKLPRSAENEVDTGELISLLKDKEEEAQRLREYVGKLLSNVVDKAPFVLENMT